MEPISCSVNHDDWLNYRQQGNAAYCKDAYHFFGVKCIGCQRTFTSKKVTDGKYNTKETIGMDFETITNIFSLCIIPQKQWSSNQLKKTNSSLCKQRKNENKLQTCDVRQLFPTFL